MHCNGDIEHGIPGHLINNKLDEIQANSECIRSWFFHAKRIVKAGIQCTKEEKEKISVLSWILNLQSLMILSTHDLLK